MLLPVAGPSEMVASRHDADGCGGGTQETMLGIVDKLVSLLVRASSVPGSSN